MLSNSFFAQRRMFTYCKVYHRLFTRSPRNQIFIVNNMNNILPESLKKNRENSYKTRLNFLKEFDGSNIDLRENTFNNSSKRKLTNKWKIQSLPYEISYADRLQQTRRLSHEQRLNSLKKYKEFDLRQLLDKKRNIENSSSLQKERKNSVEITKETISQNRKRELNNRRRQDLETVDSQKLIKSKNNIDNKKKCEISSSRISEFNNSTRKVLTKNILFSSKISLTERLLAIKGTSAKNSIIPKINVPILSKNTKTVPILDNPPLSRPRFNIQQRLLVIKSNPEEINNNVLTNSNQTFELPSKDHKLESENNKNIESKNTSTVKEVKADNTDNQPKNTPLEPTVVKIENYSEIKQILQTYPQPKCTLNNFYNILSEEFKDSSLKITPSYKNVRVTKQDSSWTCTYHIKWPINASVIAAEKTKIKASTFAACKVLQILAEHGKISADGLPLIYTKEEIKKINKQKQTKVEFDNSTINDMKKIIKIFNDNMLPTINSTNFTNYKEESLNETFGQEPDSVNLFLSKPQFLGVSQYLAKENITLPISAYKDEFIELLQKSNCVIVKGEPGCGKSSRVPQYVLESWIRDVASARNQLCRIAVTQPRRIAAISLANRVSSERNEEVGHIVGYQVRLKSNFNVRTGRILYCTTGILMRHIQSDPSLSKFSHVVLDEAHERDVNTDMLMNMLKIAIKKNPNLKIVVMSATMDAENFSNYFDGAPILNVPGFAYPVKTFYLGEEDSNFSKTLKMCKSNTPSVIYEDVVEVLKYIHKNKPEGAILVFLPGWESISKVQKLICPKNDVVVHTIHSKLKDSEQYKIFSKPPPGIRKIILSTNIAETSITIDDVVYVVDTGMHKDNIFDIEKGINVIDMEWISKASANQRAGRAGRCSPGESYRLYTKERYEKFADYSSPKILNSSLTKIVLDAKVFSNNMKSDDFMDSLITPPEKAAVRKAVDDLKQLELLDDDEKLTPLGRTLVNFQLEPCLAKAMVNSVVFKCTTPIIDIITLFSSDTEIFGSLSLTDKSSIKAVKSAYCRSSDHLALMRVYEKWLELVEEGDRYGVDRFCQKTNLVPYKLEFVNKLKEVHFDYLKNLYDVIPVSDEYSDNDELVKAVLYSGTGTVLEHRNWDIVKNRLKSNVNVLVTRNNHKATITQESVNFKRLKFPTNFLVYINETRSNIRRTTIVRECSLIHAISVLLFNNKELELIEPKPGDTIGDNLVILGIKNTKLQFLCDKEQANLLIECKKALDLSYKYLINQLTYTGEKNPEFLQNWDKILEELNKILIRNKIA